MSLRLVLVWCVGVSTALDCAASLASPSDYPRSWLGSCHGRSIPSRIPPFMLAGVRQRSATPSSGFLSTAALRGGGPADPSAQGAPPPPPPKLMAQFIASARQSLENAAEIWNVCCAETHSTLTLLARLNTVGVGMAIKKNKDGEHVITKLMPGWPAEQSGHIIPGVCRPP